MRKSPGFFLSGVARYDSAVVVNILIPWILSGSISHMIQGLSQDFHNRVSKMAFQEDRVSKPPHRKKISHHTDHIH